MTEEAAKKEFHKALFANLVMMLSSSAMQQMGKLVNPMTNKTEVNIEGAQVTIDMLDMIHAKTSGNLDDDEAKMIKDILSSLQMNYVETSQSAPEPEKESASEEDAENSEEAPDAESSADSAKEEKKDPKYHKSYGE